MKMFPRISVIIPVFNLEGYLKESIESVLSQTIGFKNNIEIILINDGSSDGSELICKDYAKRFPENIFYKAQLNFGVSSARNAGLSLSRGTYVHFFDGDDIIPNDFYSVAVDFLEKNKEEIDFVATKIKFFDAIIDSHPLNYKFDQDKIIDLSKNPDSPILHVISCVFRKECIKDVRFDEKLSVAEDVKFLSDILVKKKSYGALKSLVYFYRKRSDGGSLISGKEKNKSYYLDTPKYAYQHMLSSWQKSGDSRPIEYTLLYDLSYRLNQKTQNVLTVKEQSAYVANIKSLLIDCTDEVILKNRFLSIHMKLYILKIKYGDSLNGFLSTREGVTYFKDHKLYDHRTAQLHIDFLERLQDGTYAIEGCVEGPVSLPGVLHSIDVSGKKYPIKYEVRAQRKKAFFDDIYYEGGSFKVKIALEPESVIVATVNTPNKSIKMPITTGYFTKFGALKLTYRADEGLLLKRTSTRIRVYRYSVLRHILLEVRLLVQIIINWRFHTAYTYFRKLLSRNLEQLKIKGKIFEILKPLFIIGESVCMIPLALVLRICYYFAVHFKKRPIWVISDRGMAAGDNGEALFRYIMSRKDCPADVYFAISRKSKDFDRIKKIGRVLNHGEFLHKLKFLLADKIISSQADVETTNPFLRQIDHYVNLFNFDFIFLQHGVIRHDLSTWLNRYEKNIRLFITSSKKEYDSIFSNPYYYDKDSVLLSGLPRYDYLCNRPNKKLILAPTYRKGLVKQRTDKNGKRNYDTTFKTSFYRKFYNDFMNDNRLRKALKSADMKGEFLLHAAFCEQRQDFDENDEFSVAEFPYDYKKAFSEGEILVSDHSSVMFDFAYLKKPVVYAHFDVDTFFDSHTYDRSNFFIDEEDGFGDVYYDYDTLVNGVISLIESGCKMSEEYKIKVDNFFYRVDTNNCSRVYRAIISIK